MTANSGEQESFTIRGHHLDYLAPLFPPGKELPADIAKKLREESVRDRGDQQASDVDWDVLNSPTSIDAFYPAYGLDLVGETDEEADLYEARLKDALDRFTGLDDDDIVRLTAGRLDDICQACTHKKHCQVPGGSDQKYLDIFDDVLAYAATQDPNFAAGILRTTPEGDIITTARAVRRYIGHFAIATTWRVSLFNDAFSRHEEHGGVFAGPDASLIEQYYEEYGHEIE